MGLYEVPLSVSLLDFGIGTMLANFHVGGIMLLLRVVLNILMRNASPRGPMCFRCLIFNLFYSLLYLRSSECDVVCCSVNVSVCFVCCVFANCLVKQFAMCLGVVAILLLNVMDVFSVCGGAL